MDGKESMPPGPSSPAITVFRGFKDQGQYSWSPFVCKLEARLRFGDISNYKTEAGSIRQAPRGKLPYISLQANATTEPELLADSALIINRLIGDGILQDLSAGLSPPIKAQDLALRALLEDKLYYYQVLERWNDNYYIMRDKVLGFMPYPVKVVVGGLAHRGVMRTLYGQGVARFTPEERLVARAQVWQAFNDLATESKSKHNGSEGPFWLLGRKEPTDVDATLFGFIASNLTCTAAPETQRLLKALPVLLEYARRIHEKYFPDYETWSP